MKKYVICGNGTAAVGCIEGIRSVDREGSITVISGEDRPAYCRPLISYFLENRTDEQRMLYREENFYEKMGCEVIYGVTAEKLNAGQKTVALSNGSVVEYDTVCVAAGSSPFVPPMAGMEGVEERFSFMTMEDAIRLKEKVTPEKRVLIIGAGLIGLKCAEGLHGSVGSITVVDLADRVLSSILDTQGAALVQKKLEAAGIRFLLSDSVDHFEGHTAYMKSGCAQAFDILVTAVGVRANTALVTEAGGKAGRGITVDEGMHTSLADVYAAGDCTESTDISDGRVKVMALMPNAYLQGFTAGVNMAGGEKVFDNAIPMNAIGFFGYHIMTAGSRGSECICTEDGDDLKKLFVQDGLLTGFEIIGDVKNTGIYTSLIRNKTPLCELDAQYIKNTPQLAMFSREKREKMLGGVV